jgi:dihydrofolate reductase
MRKIVANMFVSLDGVVEAPETFTGPYFHPEVGRQIQTGFDGSDTLLLGRVTYQTFERSFSGDTTGNPMAAQMNNYKKVVVSNTMDKPTWQNSSLINQDVAAEIAKLKKQPGKNIAVSGSGSLVSWLARERLLDEIDLLVLPVVVGCGKRLFEDYGDRVPLHLAESKTFSNGVQYLKFQLTGK